MPSLRFFYPKDLHAKALAVLCTLEQSAHPEEHCDALGDIVVELTNAGMDYYFMKHLKLAKVGFIVEETVHLGIVAAMQILGAGIRTVLGGMNRRQLLSVCQSIRQLMR